MQRSLVLAKTTFSNLKQCKSFPYRLILPPPCVVYEYFTDLSTAKFVSSCSTMSYKDLSK